MLLCSSCNGSLKTQLAISVHQLSTFSKESFKTDSNLSERFWHGPLSITWSGTRLLNCYAWRVTSPDTQIFMEVYPRQEAIKFIHRIKNEKSLKKENGKE